ncbi:uncharacterized protein LOC130708502 [Balaenoptera acutorostrata]|uniref:Uncharacterized protein LOC130708502 n=1 Tax=Balaenoptera acutorostrata TaxID=9767 RepID=A0ABM3TSS0_BALAC|nr:uncharacterized protein LOC130708502 [Balaenoptera acutorostrata]
MGDLDAACGGLPPPGTSDRSSKRETLLPDAAARVACRSRAQKRCARHCDSRWRQRAVCREAAPGTVVCSCEQLSCTGLQGENANPSPADETAYKADPYKAAPPACVLAGRAGTRQRELATLPSSIKESSFPLLRNQTPARCIGASTTWQEDACCGPTRKALETTISLRTHHSFLWRKIFRSQDQLDIQCVHHYFPVTALGTLKGQRHLLQLKKRKLRNTVMQEIWQQTYRSSNWPKLNNLSNKIENDSIGL